MASAWIRLLLLLTISVTLVEETAGLECYQCKDKVSISGGGGRSSDSNGDSSKVDLIVASLLGGGPKTRSLDDYPFCNGKDSATVSCDGACGTFHIKGTSEGSIREVEMRGCFSKEDLKELKIDKDCMDGPEAFSQKSSAELKDVFAIVRKCEKDRCNLEIPKTLDECKEASGPNGGNGSKGNGGYAVFPSLGGILLGAVVGAAVSLF